MADRSGSFCLRSLWRGQTLPGGLLMIDRGPFPYAAATDTKSARVRHTARSVHEKTVPGFAVLVRPDLAFRPDQMGAIGRQ